MKLWKKEKDDWWEAHDAYQTEEDGGEKKTYGAWLLSLLGSGICVFLLYFLEQKLYGEVIRTNWASFLGILIGTNIGFLIQDAIGKKTQTKVWKLDKGKKIIAYLFLLAFIGLMVFLVHSKKEMWIMGGQLLVLIPVCFLIDRLQKKGMKEWSLAVWSTLMIYVAIVAVSFILPKAAGFVTTKEAEAIVTEEGYTEAEYLGWLYDTWVYKDAQTKPFPEPQEREKQYYMVFGRKDGEPYRFIIDPEGGDIILAAAEKDEPELANWYYSWASE